MKNEIRPKEQRELINHAKKYFVPEDQVTCVYSNSGTITIKCFCKEEENNEIIYIEVHANSGHEMWAFKGAYGYDGTRNGWKLIATSRGK